MTSAKIFPVPVWFLVLLLLLVNFVWGSAIIAMKIIFNVVTPMQAMLFRVGVAGVIYLCLWRKVRVTVQKRDGKWLLLLALCEPALQLTFVSTGLNYTTASQTGVIYAFQPLMAAAGAYVFYRERISVRCLTGILIAIVGVMLVSLLGKATASAPAPLLGNFLVLLSVVAAAGFMLILKRLSSRYPFLFLCAVQSLVGTAYFIIPASVDPLPVAMTAQAWLVLLFLGLGPGFGVYLVYNYALTRLKAAYVGLFSNLIPVFSLLLAYLVLGERLEPLQYLGALLVLCGVIWAGIPEQVETPGAATLNAQ
jgi:drug/metabolite transporter (DMT)-like permease